MTRPYIDPRTLRGIYNDRLDGRPHHIVIDPQPSWTGIAVMMVVAMLIGVLLATGGVL